MYYKVLEEFPSVRVYHHEYGYESPHDFYGALLRLHAKWKGRVGECVEVRHSFMLMRFVNRFNRCSYVWMPRFLLVRAPDEREPESSDEDLEELLDEVFGFD